MSAERNIGIQETTLSYWIKQGDQNLKENTLKLPSGKEFRVIRILGEDGNEHAVVEIDDWVRIALDLVINLGKGGCSK